jgi:hypothetical protein
MRAWPPALALPLLLAACATPAPPTPIAEAPPTTCAAHAGAFRALIGMTEAEVRAALAAMPGIRSVRIDRPGAPSAAAAPDDRVAIVVSRGRVIRIACG